jgi:hypothetical protein
VQNSFDDFQEQQSNCEPAAATATKSVIGFTYKRPTEQAKVDMGEFNDQGYDDSDSDADSDD